MSAKLEAHLDENEKEERKKKEIKGRASYNDYVQVYVIEIEILKANNLMKADLFGLSDPYCEITMFGQTYKTKTIIKNLSPVWNEKTVFAFFEDPEFINFNVWDWDKGTKDDPIGDCKFSLNGFFENGHQGYYGKLKLENVKTGEIEVKINCKKLVPSELEKRTDDLQNDVDNQMQRFQELLTTIDDLIKKKRRSFSGK